MLDFSEEKSEYLIGKKSEYAFKEKNFDWKFENLSLRLKHL